MGNELLWKYWRNRVTGEHVMSMGDAYSEYPDWEMTTRDGWLKWMDKSGDLSALPVLPGSPLDQRLQAPAASAPEAGDGLSAFAQAAQGDDTLAVALYEKAVLETQLHEIEAERDALATRLREAEAALNVAEQKLNTVIYARPSIIVLRREFTALTGIVVPMGGNTIGTEEGRMLRVLMRELGYERESECVGHGWNVRFGKDGVWSEWMPKTFEESLEGEYRVAMAGIKADQQRGDGAGAEE